MSGVTSVVFFVSAGRLMSTPFCVRGSAAMKMTSSTSSTSLSGVTFMSELACGTSPLTTFSAPKCLCACSMLLASRRGSRRRVLALGDQADILDPGLPEVVHRFPDRAVLCVGVAFDQHNAL